MGTSCLPPGFGPASEMPTVHVPMTTAATPKQCAQAPLPQAWCSATLAVIKVRQVEVCFMISVTGAARRARIAASAPQDC
jgi:hypothetical protein